MNGSVKIKKMTKNKKNFATSPYTFTLHIEAGELEHLCGAMDEQERLTLIQLAKDETDDENAQIVARTNSDWRKVIDYISKPYGWWSWDKEKQEAWIESEIARQKTLPPFSWKDYDLDEVSFALPAVEITCGRCEGKGTHVEPAIDGNGITQEEWNQWGWEEREDYFNGVYDIPCYECGGDCKVKEVVKDCYLSEPQKYLLKLLEQKWNDDADYARECAVERAMGA